MPSRLLAAGFIGLSLLLGACVSVEPTPVDPEAARRAARAAVSFAPVTQSPAEMYAGREDNGFVIGGVDPAKMNPAHIRQVVDYPTTETPGTIVVEQSARFLYFVMPDGKALRYAVGVGPDADAFDGGDAIIDRKQIWPRWIPTKSMIERNPGRYMKYKDGMPGGPGNPLGARALYMQKNGVDTYYRVHGTNDPTSIGRAVSAGCIRMLSQDVIDLYQRVDIGARIVVR